MLPWGNVWSSVLPQTGHEKTDALSQCGDFEGTMELTPPVLEDINWWINNIHLSCYVIYHGEPHATLYTDVSKTGWGCEFQGTPKGGS